MMASNYSCGIERDEKKLKENNDDPTKWANPLEARSVLSPLLTFSPDKFSSLPNAPSMKLFCVYGHGKATEVRLV